MEFDEVKEGTSIAVIGVGGGGGNAVNTMIEKSLSGVEFMVANTDSTDLRKSKAKIKIQLGKKTCNGLGTGSLPDKGESSAKESEEEIKSQLKDIDILFIAAGLGGGTGTGASPIIASIAKKMEILTIGVVSLPFENEGKKRKENAAQGVRKFKENVDTLLVFENEKLNSNFSDLLFLDAYTKADEILYNAIKAISDVINKTGHMNLDTADIIQVTSNKGYALIGIGESEGENRAATAAKNAITNPLLDTVALETCNAILVNITAGQDLKMSEVQEIMDLIENETGKDKNIFKGIIIDNEMEKKISVTAIATGLDNEIEEKLALFPENKKKKAEHDKELKEAQERIDLQSSYTKRVKNNQNPPPRTRNPKKKYKNIPEKEVPVFLKQLTN